MPKDNEQSLLFRGIYEFEDQSGTLLAAKIPPNGSADLYDGTVVVVRPNQCCVFIYKGEICEIFMDGTHQLRTENIPVLTKLANFSLGFKSPLRAELWFFSGQLFTARRWGTAAPVLVNIEGQGTVPIRMFGRFNLVLKDPVKFFKTLVGTRSAFDITEVEEFIQGQIQEVAPNALRDIKSLEQLSKSQDTVSKIIEDLLEEKLNAFGIKVVELQVLSMSPGAEILKAIEAKAAINTLGDPRAYLLYQAAQSLGAPGEQNSAGQANDPMQMMLGLMLGKNLMADPVNKPSESEPVRSLGVKAGKFCTSCGSKCQLEQKFCGQCGSKI